MIIINKYKNSQEVKDFFKSINNSENESQNNLKDIIKNDFKNKNRKHIKR